MRAVVFVLLASVMFGTTGTARVLGAPDVDVTSLGAARIVVGGALLALVALLLRARRRRRPVTLGVADSPGPRLSPVVAAVAVIIGAVGVVAYQPTFFLGTERNGIAIGTLVALGSAPLATGALSWGLERRFPGVRWAIATGVAVVGLALLAQAGSPVSASGGIDPFGLLGSLGAGVSYAVYTLASKRLLDAGWSGSSTMGSVFGVAAAIGAVVLVATVPTWLGTASGVLTVLWLGGVTVAVAYLLFAAGLGSLPAPTVSTITLAEPLTATLLGVLVIGERLPTMSWVGLAVVAAGIVVLILRPRRTDPALV